MKLTKGKKQDKNKKEVPKPAIPEPPKPVRIQIEPSKASTVSLEVGATTKDARKDARVKVEVKPKPSARKKPDSGTKPPIAKPDSSVKVEVKSEQREKPAKKPIAKPDSSVKVEVKSEQREKPPPITKPASSKQPKPSKSIEISASGEKKSAPTVTVSIFDSEKKQKAQRKAAPRIQKPSPKPRAVPVPRRPQAEVSGRDMQKLKEKIDFVDRSFRVMAREVNNLKTKTASLSGKKEINELKKALEKKPTEISDSEIKSIRQFMARSGNLDNQIASINVKLGNMAKATDSFVERMNSLQRDMGEIKIKQASSKDEKSYKDISQLKERMDEIEGVLEKFSERLRESRGKGATDTGEMKTVIEKMSTMEGGMKSMREKILSMNSQIAGLAEQKTQGQGADFSPDLAKNISSRLDTFDPRIAGMTERIVKLSEDMQKLTIYFMEGIKHMESRLRVMESEKEQITRSPEPEPKFTPTTYRSHLKREQEDSEIDDYDMPRRLPPRGPSIPMPQPPPSTEGTIPSFERRQYPPLPAGRAQTPPPAPAPERGNMFTKLREATVIRRPIQQIDPDLDILLEHIRESMQKQESREKITRDLMNAGFDQGLINQAFMRFRVG